MRLCVRCRQDFGAGKLAGPRVNCVARWRLGRSESRPGSHAVRFDASASLPSASTSPRSGPEGDPPVPSKGCKTQTSWPLMEPVDQGAKIVQSSGLSSMRLLILVVWPGAEAHKGGDGVQWVVKSKYNCL
jgi:hypothetical protein